MTARAPIRRAALVLGSGFALGVALWLLDSTWGRHSGAGRPDTAIKQATSEAAVAASARSGVFALPAAPTRGAVARPAATTAARQEPPFPFSFLGRIREAGEETILLHGAGRTVKFRHTGPLDDRYVVDDLFDDRVVIRDVASGARHVVELSAREYGIPGSLRGEYPQD